MKVLRSDWENWAIEGTRSAVVIGVLDGVHRGHRRLLEGLGHDLTRTVLTFDPHPVEVLRPGSGPRLITTIEERVALLAALDVELVGVVDLRSIRDMTPRQFVEDLLVERLGIGRLVVGPDFRFGRDRAGDIALLSELSMSFGFELVIVDLVADSMGALSSSRVRSLIEAGDVAGAESILGSRFRISGVVIGGDSRGRQIGFPTANIRPPDGKVIPARGVYAAFAHLGRSVYPAAINVGVRPTFGGGELLIEAYIIDFDSDVYGELLTLEYVAYLRPELEFTQVDDLVTQMKIDVDECRRRLAATIPNMV